MEFFKRHYEKIILFGLALLLVLLLVSLLSSVATVDTSPLSKPEMHRVDHQLIDFAQEAKFDLPAQLAKANQVWQLKFVDQMPVDLTSPLLVARCPHCDRLLPIAAFMSDPHVCPFVECGRELPTPQRDVIGNILKKYAWGTSDIKEEDLYDDDMDGFSFRYELEKGTDPFNPVSHPALWERLYVTDVNRMPLGGVLTVVNAPINSSENSWYIQIDTPVLNDQGRPTKETKRTLLFLRDKIKLDGNEFQVIEITPRYPSGATDAETAASNESTARLKQVSGGRELELELKINTESFYPEQKIFMKDLGSKEEYCVDVDDVFTVGNNMIGQFRYKVEARDTEKREVSLIDEVGNRTVITATPQVPAEMRAVPRKVDERRTTPGTAPLNPQGGPNRGF